MLYGLHFVSDAGEALQIRVDTNDCSLHVRSTNKGAWGTWRRLDVQRNADGTLNAEVAKAARATSADTAVKLAKPIKITFTGGASGSATFDGSKENVSCSLAINQQDVSGPINKAISDHVKQHHYTPPEGGGGN